MSCIVLHHFPINLSQSNSNPDQKKLFINPKSNVRIKDCTFQPHEELFTNVLNSLSLSTKRRDSNLGSSLHAQISKLGITTDVLISNSLLSMYAKCNLTQDAHKVFNEMPLRTVASWTSLIWAYCQEEREHDAISLFKKMLENLQPNEHTLAVLTQACAKMGSFELTRVIHCYAVKFGLTSDGFLMNCLIDAYAKSGSTESAEMVLDMLSNRDVVAWTSAISGHVWNGRADKAINLFFRMQEDDVQPNEVTILSVLHACSCINQTCLFQYIHGLVVKSTEWFRNSLVMNSLVEMYLVNGFFHEGVKIFCSFCFMSFNGESNFLCIETMAKLIQGCSLKLGEGIHGYLVKNGFLPCNVIENSLLVMYSRNDRYDSVNLLFGIMRFKDTVTWNTMISCLVKNKQPENALKLLTQISSPDFVTMISSLQACSSLASLQLGEIIHGYIIRTGMINDIILQNSLIDMYAKSGNLCLSERIFIEMNSKDVGSWNSMIMSYGINSDGISALSIFKHLMKTHQPNDITFVNILAACGHNGLITEGLEIFDRMEIEPRMEHYACMVDLLGRAGKVEEAEAFIAKMTMSPGGDVWGALLGACLLFNNVEVAERAVRHLGVMEPNRNYWKVSMANIYARNGRWEDAAKMRNEVKKKNDGVEGHGRKEEGWSCLEIRGEMVRFVTADLNHQQIHEIYRVLNGIHSHIREAYCKEFLI
ncbi:pentatricopeptide repeat-containing protein At3g57430, chloroplastic-like [Impatiens glandulifera]|uniref:pentatricopeptide repeat-containing protein At3g57430, chloroplastic-like n=1 Tax=Impatiens glandulifera TaxID=253017 RepID=UPI001FB12E1F|nr:pentatricopeptide repeat-containing protein At3g57430, chloroplastic-like [Impatiens glandulifera]